MFHCGFTRSSLAFGDFLQSLNVLQRNHPDVASCEMSRIKSRKRADGHFGEHIAGKRGASTQVTTNVQAGNHKKTALWIVLLTTPDLRKHKTSHEHEIDFLLATSLQYRYSSLNTEKPNWVGRICLLHWLKKWLHVPGTQSRVLNCNKTEFERKHDFMNSVH